MFSPPLKTCKLLAQLVSEKLHLKNMVYAAVTQEKYLPSNPSYLCNCQNLSITPILPGERGGEIGDLLLLLMALTIVLKLLDFS